MISHYIKLPAINVGTKLADCPPLFQTFYLCSRTISLSFGECATCVVPPAASRCNTKFNFCHTIYVFAPASPARWWRSNGRPTHSITTLTVPIRTAVDQISVFSRRWNMALRSPLFVCLKDILQAGGAMCFKKCLMMNTWAKCESRAVIQACCLMNSNCFFLSINSCFFFVFVFLLGSSPLEFHLAL